MVLDLPTTMAAVAMVSAITGMAVLYVGGSARAAPSLRIWGASLMVYAIQPLTFAWRFDGPLAPSVVLSNANAMLVLVIQWEAVVRFREELPSAHPAGFAGNWRAGLRGIVGLPLLAGALALLLLPYDFARNGIGTLLLVTTATVLAIVTHRSRETESRGRQLLLGGTALLVALLVWRLAALVEAKVTAVDFQQTAYIHAITYLVTIGTLLLQTLGFVLWHKERAVDREHSLAEHDALTGCLNRRALFERADAMLRNLSRRQRPVSVLVIDLDLFKHINDRYGHLAGDAVLRDVSRRWTQRLRGGDVLARLGGEEFMVIADDTDDAGARTLAEDLRRAAADAPVRHERDDIDVTVSIGVHCHVASEATPTFDSMIAAADGALYRAKSAGRNCVV